MSNVQIPYFVVAYLLTKGPSLTEQTGASSVYHATQQLDLQDSQTPSQPASL